MIRACKMQSCPSLHNNPNGFCDKHQSLTTNRPCRTPGCPNHSVFRGQCEQCAKIDNKQYDQVRQAEHTTTYDDRWRELSRAYRNQHPTCEMCEERGIITQSVLVHHKTPIDDGGGRLDLNNLQALCRDCHERRHGRKK